MLIGLKYFASDVVFSSRKRITLNGRPAGRAGWRTVLPNEKHEFSAGSAGWRAAQKGRPAGCTTRQASGLRKRAGWSAALFCSPPRLFPQPAGLPFCKARWPALLSSVQPAIPPTVHVFHLETRPSSLPSVKRNFWFAKFLSLHHVHMHRVIFYITNTLIKLIFALRNSCLGKCVGIGFGLEWEKDK